MPGTIKTTAVVLELLQHACARGELLILATPFLRYESTFVALEAHELHVAATMNQEDARYSLQQADLAIRFPQGLGFIEGSTRILGLGLHQGQRTLRLAIPKVLHENDQQVAYRVGRIHGVPVTFTTETGASINARLADISVTGLRLDGEQNLELLPLVPGQALNLTVFLMEGLCVDATAIIKHIRGPRVGVQFVPPLSHDVVAPLSRWVFLKREEEREHIARRMEQALPAADRQDSTLPSRGILLFSHEQDLEPALRTALEGIQPVSLLQPTAEGVKTGLASQPTLAIFHIPSHDMDTRRHYKALGELTAGRVPLMVISSTMDGSDLYDVGGEMKAVSTFVWHPARAPFFRRLVQGIIRRHRSGGDSPMAPSE